jgi:hypothetical protein
MINASHEFEVMLGKALVDEDFRDLLYSDRAAALGGYQPSADETDLLDATTREAMDEAAEAVKQVTVGICANVCIPSDTGP